MQHVTVYNKYVNIIVKKDYRQFACFYSRKSMSTEAKTLRLLSVQYSMEERSSTSNIRPTKIVAAGILTSNQIVTVPYVRSKGKRRKIEKLGVAPAVLGRHQFPLGRI